MTLSSKTLTSFASSFFLAIASQGDRLTPCAILVILSVVLCLTLLALGTALQGKKGLFTLILSRSLGGTVLRRILPAVVLIPLLIGSLTLAGQAGHLFDVTFAIQLIVLTIITAVGGIVFWTAIRIEEADRGRVAAEEKLREMTITDELTGLHNRRGFFQLAEREMSRATREQRTVCILYMDVDCFKDINDGWGHDEGDRALRRVARVLKDTLRPTDVVARLGGDEFTVLLLAERKAVAQIQERLRSNLNLENRQAKALYPLDVTIGISSSEDEADDLIGLLRRADELMMKKKAGSHRTAAIGQERAAERNAVAESCRQQLLLPSRPSYSAPEHSSSSSRSDAAFSRG